MSIGHHNNKFFWCCYQSLSKIILYFVAYKITTLQQGLVGW